MSRADTEYTMEKGMYYSLYIQHVYTSNNAVFSTSLVTDRKINQQNKLEQAFITPSIFPYVILFSIFFLVSLS